MCYDIPGFCSRLNTLSSCNIRISDFRGSYVFVVGVLGLGLLGAEIRFFEKFAIGRLGRGGGGLVSVYEVARFKL